MDEAGYLKALQHNRPQLTSLHCPVKVYNIEAEDWTDIFRHMPKLNGLQFGYDAIALGDRAILMLAKACPSLLELSSILMARSPRRVADICLPGGA
ncbi:hypothetical protein BG000_007867 [Podila horticola]|nr:hypothetical protein BG000_007867 [Podila horticola]